MEDKMGTAREEKSIINEKEINAAGKGQDFAAAEKRREKRKMWLTIRGVQSGSGQEEVTEIAAAADYFVKDGKQYIFYQETIEGGGLLKNRLTISENGVELKKTGNGISLLTFCPGYLKPCVYQSPAGALEFVSDTKTADVRVTEDGLKITLAYSFYMNETLVADYHLTGEGKFLPEDAPGCLSEGVSAGEKER